MQELNVRRGTPVIEQIVRTDETIQKINELLAIRINTQSRNSRLKRLTGGFCINCRGIPSKKVTFSPMEGAKLVDYYCDNCFPADIKNLK